MLSQTELTTSQFPSAAGTAPTSQAGASNGSRMLFVDNLRILLISMVLVVHLDDTYGAIGSWDYHDPATNLLTGTLLSIPNAIGMASGMGFFFLLAGYFTPGSYDRKGPRAFLQDRLMRLGLPLLLYDLLIHPLVVYIGGGLHGSYWSFYGTFLLQMRGVTGVVWFLAVLLLFDLLYAAWRGLTRHRNADDRQNWKTSQLSSDLWLHLRARSGELCSAYLVASRLDFSTAQRACGLSSPIYQPLHSRSDCLSS